MVWRRAFILDVRMAMSRNPIMVRNPMPNPQTGGLCFGNTHPHAKRNTPIQPTPPRSCAPRHDPIRGNALGPGPTGLLPSLHG